MTIDKASERYHIPAELLWEYESWGLCGGVKKVMGARRYDDRDMERLSMVMTLKNGGRSQKDWWHISHGRATPKMSQTLLKTRSARISLKLFLKLRTVMTTIRL